MTTSSATKHGGAGLRQARGVAGWLALAASPTLALMGWIAANDAHPVLLCSSGSHILPLDGMSAMYLLMSLFHVSPWLKIASARPCARASLITEGERL